MKKNNLNDVMAKLEVMKDFAIDLQLDIDPKVEFYNHINITAEDPDFHYDDRVAKAFDYARSMYITSIQRKHT